MKVESAFGSELIRMFDSTDFPPFIITEYFYPSAVTEKTAEP
jgi:hypothetical protein